MEKYIRKIHSFNGIIFNLIVVANCLYLFNVKIIPIKKLRQIFINHTHMLSDILIHRISFSFA